MYFEEILQEVAREFSASNIDKPGSEPGHLVSSSLKVERKRQE